jgi:hypothetical protein
VNKRGGMATIVTMILAAFIGVSYLPKKAAESAKPESAPGSASRAATKTQAVTPIQEANLLPACQRIRLHLERFYPKREDVPVPSDSGCRSNEPDEPTASTRPAPASGSPPPLSVAIAIVPNPVQTHLPMMFDRLIDAIQQAVQDSGFNFDTAWFPWNPNEKAEKSSSDSEQSDELKSEAHSQPGIILFRRSAAPDSSADPYQSGVVVFVVAEQPTGGVNHMQFAHAVAWAKALGSRELRIIGPTFSGTLGSLQHDLVATGATTDFPEGVRIFSGATSAADNVSAFINFRSQKSAPATAGGPSPPPLQFRTFFESDQLMTDRFLCYMQRGGYDLSYFAILSEDQTAYGEAPTAASEPRCSDHKGKDGTNLYEGTPLYLYYPRDIAKLRSAYEQQSVFSAGKQQSGAPSTSLKEDLSDPDSAEHDTVRSYAGKLSPQTQEAVLFGLASVLASRNIEFIIIRSTNTLDQLFLSEFLRRSYPNGRVVLDGADIMFRRGMEGASLRGVMMLSTYPLLTWTRDAVPTIEGPPGTAYRLFPQDSAEGTYIATRELLKNPGVRNPIPIADYAPPHFEETGGAPQARDERPPTWLTVVGNRQFWPLAFLDDQTLKYEGQHHGPTQSGSLLKTETNRYGNRWGRTGLPLELWGLLGACFFLALWHWYCCANGSIHRPPKLRAYFAPVPRLQHSVLIFIGSLVLAFLALNLWLMVVIPGYQVLAWPTAAGLSAACLAIFVFAYFGLVGNYRLGFISGKNDAERRKRLDRIKRWRVGLQRALVPSALLLGLVWYLFLPIHLGPANRVPLFWRTVFLRSGLSGILPQVLLLLGLYAWYWFSLHGMALFGDDRPRLPRVDDLPCVPEPAAKGSPPAAQPRQVEMFLMFSREGAGDNIEAEARPMSKRYRASLKYFLPISYLALWVAVGGPILSWHWGMPLLPGLRTLGDIHFGIVVFFGVAVCCGLVLADTFQLRNTWSQLRQLLLYLDRLRLRRTLFTLRGLYGGSVWKLSGNLLEERYRLISRQLESLRTLDAALNDWLPTDSTDGDRRDAAIAKVKQCLDCARTFAVWYVDLMDDRISLTERPCKETDITNLTNFQHMLAQTAGCVMTQIILPEWQQDPNTMLRASESKDVESNFDKQVAGLPPHVSAAEEFFLLPYMGFIQNILGRIRTIVLSIVVVFVAMTLAVSSYPFDPLPLIGAVFLTLFAIVGVAMLSAYAEMCRDATLSRIADTKPGELGIDFWVKMIAFGAGPALGLLTTLFPSMTDFIVSFLQPGAQAIK